MPTYDFKPAMTSSQETITPEPGQLLFDYTSGALRITASNNQPMFIGATKIATESEINSLTSEKIYPGEFICDSENDALYYVNKNHEVVLLNKAVKFVSNPNALINMTDPDKTAGQLFVIEDNLSLMSYINGQWETLGGATDVGVLSISAGNNGITIGGDAAAPTVSAKISPDSGNALSVRANGLYASSPSGVAKIGYFTIPNGTNGNYTLTHNFNTSTILVQAYGATSKKSVWLDYTVTNANSLTITFSTALTEALTVVIVHA